MISGCVSEIFCQKRTDWSYKGVRTEFNNAHGELSSLQYWADNYVNWEKTLPFVVVPDYTPYLIFCEWTPWPFHHMQTVSLSIVCCLFCSTTHSSLHPHASVGWLGYCLNYPVCTVHHFITKMQHVISIFKTAILSCIVNCLIAPRTVSSRTIHYFYSQNSPIWLYPVRS